MKPLRQKLLIAALLFAGGAVFYLVSSGGPLWVHRLTVPLQLGLLLGGVLAAWAPRLRWPARVCWLALLVLAYAAIWTAVMSKDAFRLLPPDPFFLTMTAGYAAELLLFLGVVWCLDRAVRWLSRQRPASA
jgi:hypothetical protein